MNKIEKEYQQTLTELYLCENAIRNIKEASLKLRDAKLKEEQLYSTFERLNEYKKSPLSDNSIDGVQSPSTLLNAFYLSKGSENDFKEILEAKILDDIEERVKLHRVELVECQCDIEEYTQNILSNQKRLGYHSKNLHQCK